MSGLFPNGTRWNLARSPDRGSSRRDCRMPPGSDAEVRIPSRGWIAGMSGALALARRVGWVAVILTLCLLCRRARGNGISTFDVNALERLGQIRIVPRDIDIIRCASLG